VKKIVVFDFDGTITTGISHYIYCANIIADNLEPPYADAFLDEVNNSFSGKKPFIGEDGWDLLNRISRKYSDRNLFEHSFHQTRRHMLLNIHKGDISENVISLLKDVHSLCTTALASNSPEEYVKGYLDKLDLEKHFDYVRFSAKKPEGLIDLVFSISGGMDPADLKVLSVGDHYVNDIQPALRMKWDTAFINPFHLDSRGSTVSGQSISDLSEWIVSWCKM